MTKTLPRHKFMMAPLLGVTDSCYRETYMACFGGFDGGVAPFLKTLAEGRWKESKLKDLDPKWNPSLDLEPQIISNNVEDFVALAKRLEDWGYMSINLNLGCPVPMAAGRGRGAGLIPHRDFLEKFLSNILEQTSQQLSIKTRIGYQEPDELLQIIPLFNSLPLKEVTIHPRTAKDLYKGEINHEAFQKILPLLKHKVVYSGDINSKGDWERLKKLYPTIRTWMVGRGGIRNPGLVPSLAGISPQKANLEEFFRMLQEGYLTRGLQPSQVLQKLKGIWFYQAPTGKLCPKLIKYARKEKHLESFHPYVSELQVQISW